MVQHHLGGLQMRTKENSKDTMGANAVVRKLSCSVFINLCVSDIPVKNVFQVSAAWLAEIMICKVNSILHITVE